jgi:hypothetical protein
VKADKLQTFLFINPSVFTNMGFLLGLLYALSLTAATCFWATPAYADGTSLDAQGYQLGKGLQLGNSGLWLGGYSTLRVEDLKNTPWSAQLSDLSLFVGWQKGRWRFFSEFEIGNGLVVGSGQGLTTYQGYFDLERLYLDYLADDTFKVRAGKFLTPIGRWNQIHADPLVWTTSKPLIVNEAFAMHVTGGMAYGNFEVMDKLWSYAVYGGGDNQLDFVPPLDSNDDNFRDTSGFRLYHESPGKFQFGLSYAHYYQVLRHPGEKNLLGLDFFWIRKRYELSSEFVYRFGAGKTNAAVGEPRRNNLWGLYLQGVAPLVGDLYAVLRYEAFQRESASVPGNLGVVGLAYRPMPPLVFKAEYRFGSNFGNPPPSVELGDFSEGFAASVAVLF